MSLGRRCSAVTSWTTANQDCHGASARARLYKSPLAAAVQSCRPDLIECGNLPALALPRDKLAIATARRRGRDRATRDGTVAVSRKIQQEILLEIHTNIQPDILLEIRSYTAWCICKNKILIEKHTYTCIYWHTSLQSLCQYMHVWTGYTCIYCCSQGNILLIGSLIHAYTYIYDRVRIIYFTAVYNT